MNKGRMEAFSDGVIAIIVTIMVLELKVPHDPTMNGLKEVAPHFLSYLLSFVVVGIIWLNHHHMMQKVKSVNNRLLWANNFLLFAMSLIPFATAYMGEHYMEPLPVACYGVSLLICGTAFTVCRFAAVAQYTDPDSEKVFHLKDLTATVLYALSIPLAYVSVYLSFAIYIAIAVAYFLPGLKHDSQHPG